VDSLKECLETERKKYESLAEASEREHQDMFHFLEGKDEMLKQANRKIEMLEHQKNQVFINLLIYLFICLIYSFIFSLLLNLTNKE